MKHCWIISKSKSKTPFTFGQKIDPSTETECDMGLLNQPSDPKGLRISFKNYKKLCNMQNSNILTEVFNN